MSDIRRYIEIINEAANTPARQMISELKAALASYPSTHLVHFVAAADSHDPNSVAIYEFLVLKRAAGIGREVLKIATNLADRFQVKLLGDPSAGYAEDGEGKTLSSLELVNWYSRIGFVWEEGEDGASYMVRYPQKLTHAITNEARAYLPTARDREIAQKAHITVNPSPSDMKKLFPEGGLGVISVKGDFIMANWGHALSHDYVCWLATGDEEAEHLQVDHTSIVVELWDDFGHIEGYDGDDVALGKKWIKKHTHWPKEKRVMHAMAVKNNPNVVRAFRGPPRVTVHVVNNSGSGFDGEGTLYDETY